MRSRRQKVICILATCFLCASFVFIPVSVSAADTTTQEDIFNFDSVNFWGSYSYFVFDENEADLRETVEDSSLSQLIDETELYWEVDGTAFDHFGYTYNGFDFDGNPARDPSSYCNYCFGVQIGSIDSFYDPLTTFNRIAYAKIDFLVNNLSPTYFRFVVRDGHNSTAGVEVFSTDFIQANLYSMIDQGSQGEFLIRSVNDGLSGYDFYKVPMNLMDYMQSGDIYLEIFFEDFIPVQKFDHYTISLYESSFINFVQYVDYWPDIDQGDPSNQYVPPAFVNPIYPRPDNKPVEDESSMIDGVVGSFQTSLDNWDRLSDEFLANFGRFRLAMTTVGTLMSWCSGFPYFNFVVTFSLTLGIISFFLGMTNMIGKFF